MRCFYPHGHQLPDVLPLSLMNSRSEYTAADPDVGESDDIVVDLRTGSPLHTKRRATRFLPRCFTARHAGLQQDGGAYYSSTHAQPRIELTGREVIFVIGLFFLSTFSLALVVVLIDRGDVTDHVTSDITREACVTRECLTTAAHLATLMNTSVDPCADFWRYSCGGWLSRTEIPAAEQAWGIDRELMEQVDRGLRQQLERPAEPGDAVSVHKVKRLYRQCMDVRAIDQSEDGPVRRILRDLEGSNSFNGKANWSLQDGIEKSQFKYRKDVFFTVYVAYDDKNSSQRVVKIDQGGLGIMLNRQDYLNNSTNTSILAYRRFIRDIVQLIYNDEPASFSDEYISNLIKFESELASIHVSEDAEERLDLSSMYNRISIGDLERIAPSIKWSHFIQHLTDNTKLTQEVVVSSINYLRNLSQLISRTEKRTLKFYVVWQVVSKFAAELSIKYRHAAQQFRDVILGTTEPQARWQFCLELLNDLTGPAVGAMFVRDRFSVARRDDVMTIVDGVRRAFTRRLDTLDWLDGLTRMRAKRKLESMVYKIGYPAFVANNEDLDNYYDQLVINEKDDYIQSLLNTLSFTLKTDKKKLANRLKNVWNMNPHEVNAYYDYSKNEMVFPAGMLQWPYYQESVPKYMSYGGIGTTIGHELTHAFDNIGAQYDRNGNMVNWWTDHSWSRFKNRTQCLVDFYSRYSVMGHKVNGELTQGENLADIGGLSLALEAYREWTKIHGEEKLLPGINLSNEQKLFLSYGQSWCVKRRKNSILNYLRFDPHAVESVRCKASVAQIPDFAKAFKCPHGSAARAKNVCSVW